MKDIGRYYEEELSYLIEAGREYARLHPDRARYLNLADPRSRDPHVERLIESFAFLSGAVRQKLEDEFPELTHALLDLVWPHFLRPIPPIALLQFAPIPGMVREPQVVPRGFLVESKPTSEQVPCRFATAYDVGIYPIALGEAGLSTDQAGRRSLLLGLTLDEGADPATISIERLRVHLAGEPAVAFRHYRFLRTQVDSVVLRLSRDNRRVLPPSCVRRVGFSDREGLLHSSAVSFPGYRLLSEYFAFPEKFLFVDFVGLGPLELPRGERRFELEVRFRQRPPDSFRPSTEDFALYVTPVVNQFRREGEPILVDQLKRAYRVLGDYTHPDAYEVISVDSVEGLRRSDGARRRHPAFFSFEHGPDEAGSGGEYFHVTDRVSPAGGWQTFLSLVSPSRGHLPGPETLSLALTCMNGRLCQEVGAESLRVAAEERLDFATFRNITRPTDPVYPKLGEGSEWSFISHMALNVLSIADAAALRSILSLYDVGDQPANRRRIDAVRGLRAIPREVLVRGTPIRGTELALTVDETHFDDEGELLLFSDVLSEFFALYAPTNSFTELVVVCEPSGEVKRCQPATGKQSLI